MGVGHRQALRLLARRNVEVGGRLLRYPKSIIDHVRINDGKRRGEDIMTVVPASAEDYATGF